jgi:hypothetical protein
MLVSDSAKSEPSTNFVAGFFIYASLNQMPRFDHLTAGLA